MSMQWWKCALAFCILRTVLCAQAHPDVSGEWEGKLAGKLRIILHVEKGAEQSLRGVLESPDQGGAKLPMDEFSFDGKQGVHFEVKVIGASFEGSLTDDKSEIRGTFQQGALKLPLTLRRPGAAAPTNIGKLQPLTKGSVPLQPCVASDGETQALCGSFDVFENRATRTGRKIALNLMLLPALSPKAAADAVFGFAGGPGQSAVKSLPFLGFVKALQEKHDVVLVDQRGTGKSNPLDCPVDRNDAQTLIGRAYSLAGLAVCRTELEKRADLAQYTTSDAVDDVDDVRQALGYEKVNVVGASYGSQAALVYLRRHAGHVRAVAIEGVAPPDYRLPLPFAKTIQSALQHLFADCAADAACHRDYPKLQAEFETILERLDRAPARFDFRGGGSSAPQPVTLARGEFISALRPLLYLPSVVSQLPYMFDRAYRNDWSGFAATSVEIHRAIADDAARGMALSVICSESLPFIADSDIERETGGTYLRDFDVRIDRKACAVWPHAVVSRDFAEPVRSDAPVLLIAGEEDPATPPWWAQHAAQTLPHAQVIAIPKGTHQSGAACIDNMVTKFIETGSASAIDARCVERIHNPPFVTLEQVEKMRAIQEGR